MNRYLLHKPRPIINYSLKVGDRVRVNAFGISEAMKAGVISADISEGYVVRIFQHEVTGVEVMHDKDSSTRNWSEKMLDII